MKYSFNAYKENLSQIVFDFIEVSKWHIYDVKELLSNYLGGTNKMLISKANLHTPELGNSEKVKLANNNFKCNEIRELQLNRKSSRKFSKTPMSFEKVSALLRNSYFIINKEKKRFNIPSAGAMYPSEVYLLVINIDSLEKGVYYYNPYEENLCLISKLNQTDINEIFIKGFIINHRNDIDLKNASAILIYGSILNRPSIKYKERGVRFAFFDIGSILQTTYMICEILKIGICANGGFIDDYLAKLIGFKDRSQVIMLTAVIGELND